MLEMDERIYDHAKRQGLGACTGWSNMGRTNREEIVAYNLRFPERVFDGQAGLHLNGYRDFDPAGREPLR